MRNLRTYSRQALALLLIFLLLPVLPGASCAETGVLTLPKNLTVIGKEAFRGDDSIVKVVLQEGITSIQSLAFADSSLREIHLPASLTFIAEDAFDNSCLQTVTAPKGCYAYQWAREHRYMVEYRALLIGEKTFLGSERSYETDPVTGEVTETISYFKEMTIRNSNDVTKMAAMLDRVYGPAGTKYQTTPKINAGYDTIRSLIGTTFADTKEQDISVFFIATHGNSDEGGDGDLKMPFTGDENNAADRDAYSAKEYLSFETLAEWLSGMVQGKVIVILESCGAGSAIYESNGAKGGGDISEDIVRSAVKAFAKADPGIIVESGEDNRKNSTGSMRQPKFYVLAAAAHEELSWGYGNSASDPVNLFTKWLIQGVGVNGNSPADTDMEDSVLTIHELYRYIQSVGDNYKITSGGKVYYQHVQAYPENSDQEVFLLK